MLLGLRGGWGGLAGHRRGEGDERGHVVDGGDAVPLMKRRVILFCGSCPFLGVIAGMCRVSARAAPAGEKRPDQGHGGKGNG